MVGASYPTKASAAPEHTSVTSNFLIPGITGSVDLGILGISPVEWPFWTSFGWMTALFVLFFPGSPPAKAVLNTPHNFDSVAPILDGSVRL